MRDAVSQLKQIAAQLRQLRQSLDFVPPLKKDAIAGDLVLEAIGLGAFSGPEYVELQTLIRRQQVDPSPDSPRQIFLETFVFVCPNFRGDYELSYGLVGDAIEAEATKLEAAAKQCGDGRVREKKSTVRGEAQEKIISALTLHHKYQDGGCLNLSAIGVNELARKAEVGKASVNRFFNKRFGGEPEKDGHKKYMGVCRDTRGLIASLKLLNGEFSPSALYGRNPPNQGQEEEDE